MNFRRWKENTKNILRFEPISIHEAHVFAYKALLADLFWEKEITHEEFLRRMKRIPYYSNLRIRQHDYIKNYTFSVFFSEEDKEFVGVCAEFPSLSHLDKTRLDAFNGIVNLTRRVTEDMESKGEIPPKAKNQKSS